MTSTANPTTAKTATRKSRFGFIKAIARQFRYVFSLSTVLLVVTWATLALYGWKPGPTADMIFTGIAFVIMVFEIAKTMTTDELGKGAFIIDLATGLLEWSIVEAVFIVTIMQGRFDGSLMTTWAMVAFVLVETMLVIPNRFAIVARQITATDINKGHHHDPDHN